MPNAALVRRLLRSLVVATLLVLAVGSRAARADAPRPEPALDRSTPRRTLEGFLRASQAGDGQRAAQYLDLRGIPAAQRAREGASLAHRLGLVLQWTVVVDTSGVSNDPEGDPSDGPDADVVASVPLDDEAVPIALTKAREGGAQIWLVSRTTLARVPALYAAHGARWLGDRMPKVLSRYQLFDLALWQWIGLLLACLLAYAIGMIGGSLFRTIAERIAKRTTPTWDDDIAHAARGPSRLALGAVALDQLTDWLHLTASARIVVDRAYATLLIASAAWFVIRLIRVGAMTLEGSLPAEDTVGELRSRGIRTRVSVLRRIASILVGILGAAVILMQFDFVRSFGMSLLASAGIAGVALGLAAQRSLSGIVAGIHLSITQPVRIGDIVVIEGQSGTVEQINLTYVVVRVWDDRRLIVPIARFLESPFENWTRTTPALLAPVHLHVDFGTPIGPLRDELVRLCKNHPLWDGRMCRLQVTDVADRSAVVRALVSAGSAEKAWDLRCDVREGLLGFLQRLEGGVYLPHVRVGGRQPAPVTAAVAD